MWKVNIPSPPCVCGRHGGHAAGFGSDRCRQPGLHVFLNTASAYEAIWLSLAPYQVWCEVSLSHTHTPCEIVFALARIRPAPLGKAHPESPKTQPRRPDIEVVWRLSVFVWMLCPKSSRSILPECWAEQLIACAHFNHLESDGAPLRVDFAGHGRSKSHLDIPVEPNSK